MAKLACPGHAFMSGQLESGNVVFSSAVQKPNSNPQRHRRHPKDKREHASHLVTLSRLTHVDRLMTIRSHADRGECQYATQQS